MRRWNPHRDRRRGRLGRGRLGASTRAGANRRQDDDREERGRGDREPDTPASPPPERLSVEVWRQRQRWCCGRLSHCFGHCRSNWARRWRRAMRLWLRARHGRERHDGDRLGRLMLHSARHRFRRHWRWRWRSRWSACRSGKRWRGTDRLRTRMLDALRDGRHRRGLDWLGSGRRFRSVDGRGNSSRWRGLGSLSRDNLPRSYSQLIRRAALLNRSE